MMAEAEDYRPLQSKHKAITALLPWAVWREREGQPEMFYITLRAARASRTTTFMWCHVDQFTSTLLSEASPRAIVLASPHILWYQLRDRGDLVRYWVAAASAIPYSEEIAQNVVDMLLQIASECEPWYIPVDLWSWLTKRPSLPPICPGRHCGTSGFVVEVVRALKDLEVLKSYLLLVWSEWDTLYCSGFDKMCTLIREDFGGVEMGRHRTDLILRLDHVLGQFDRGLEYFQYKPQFSEYNLQDGKNQYRKLREMLLEINSRTPFTDYAPLYTDSDLGCTQNPAQHLCVHSLPRVHSLTAGTLDTPIPYSVCTSASVLSAWFITSPDTRRTVMYCISFLYSLTTHVWMPMYVDISHLCGSRLGLASCLNS